VSIVRMPPVLRANVGGAKQLEIDGATVGEVLDALVAAHPTLRDQLFTPDGDLNRFVNVYVNDQDIRYLQERATPVGSRDTLILLPAMAGGADSGRR
jgi:molybdopterin converting factor small subunit